jgi:hypothetical protein
MRSKFLACAAVGVVAIYGGLATTARAADPKGKASKKKSSELMDDQISRQMQWEDKVMGPDDKRAELDKIARAQAVNKAAAEKAEREKADREKAAAREAAAPKPQVKRNDVALPTLSDEGAKAEKGKPHEISPKLETAAAAAPPPPVRPADDKFIDKLLKDEPAGKKKTAHSSSDDKELASLLTVSKPDKPAAKAKGKSKGGDTVDSLLEAADREPAAPAPKVKHEVPEWAKPEIESTHTAVVSPIARPQPKKDDGIIHVVQGAATPNAPASRNETVASRVAPPAASPSRRGAPARASGGWNDPFSDGGGSKKSAMAARDRDFDAPPPASTRRSAPVAPAAPARSSRGGASSGSWDDPFADPPSKPARREPAAAPAQSAPRKAPAAPARWKDPFGDNEPSAAPPARSAHSTVAMREPAKSEPSKWEVAARRPAAAPSDASHSRWSILKKRAH